MTEQKMRDKISDTSFVQKDVDMGPKIARKRSALNWLWLLGALWVAPSSLMSQTQPPAEAAAAKPDQSTVQSPQASGSPVKVFLTVSGKRISSAVPTPSELVVSVDKQPASITSLRPAKNDKLLFALLVDVSGSNRSKAGEIKAVALQLFKELSADGNDGFLVTFNAQVQVMMSNSPLQLSQVQAALDAIQFGGGTALNDAIWKTCKHLLSRSGNPGIDRRVIVVITDGDDNYSRANQSEAEQIAQEEGVTIFSLATSSIDPSYTQGITRLKEISRSTGGLRISPDDRSVHADDGVLHLIEAVRDQWVMTILPQQVSDQKLHSLSVKSSQKGVHLSAPAQILLQ